MARRMAQNGAPTHEIERQGRWKQGGGMVGRYTRGESAGSALRYLSRLYAKFKGGNGYHHVGTPPLAAGVGGFSLSAANADVQELPATLCH